MKIKSIFFLNLLCLIAISCNWKNKIPFGFKNYGENNFKGKYQKIRGFKMYYEIYGEGDPVLIIHGNGGSIKSFIYQIPYFSKNYKVIVADSRSQGRSLDNTDSLSYEMMADDFNALLDTLKIPSCNIIGWSDGGINGLLLAIRHPEKVKKLAITGANLWPDSTAIDPEVYKIIQKGYNDLISSNTLKKQIDPGFGNKLKLSRLIAKAPHISINELKSIRCPTLVIGGDHDAIRPRHTLLIAEAIPQSYLWIIPNSGHSTPLFYNDQFNKTINTFFTKPYRKIEGMNRFF